MKRRELLKTAIVLPMAGSLIWSCSQQRENTDNKLKILILGGTSFLGPHQIATAIGRGHQITTFTRGKTQPTIHTDLFEQVDMLIGDRENDLKALETGEWDIVIDNSGRKESWTAATAELLKDRVGHYIYTSSTGVYYPYLGENIKEDTKLVMETPEDLEFEWERMEYDYGVMKTKSELAAKKAFGEERTIVVRPTYMIGPGDQTDRFIYWPIRLSRGGEVLVPGKENDPVQYIDVRDVANFMIHLAEQKAAGTYNAAGPAKPESMRSFVQQAQKAFDVESSFAYVDDYEFLEANDIPYLIPWIPPTGGNYGSARSSNEKAKAAGLEFRPVEQSVKDIFEWWNSDAVSPEKRSAYQDNPASLLNREEEVLQKWNNR